MARERDTEREIVYVERDEGSLKPILFGALIGLAVGVLFAPQSGDETRRLLKRRIRRARALAEEKVGELSERLTEGRRKPSSRPEPDDERAEMRSELERRLQETRARRRPAAEVEEEDEDEEPVA